MSLRSRWPLILATFAIATGSTRTAAQADTRPIVAVWYFQNNSIGAGRSDFDGLERGIADLLITDLAGAGRVRVVEREQIQKLLQEQNLVRERHIDDATAIRLGRMLGASYSITGGFMNAGNTMTLTARVINLETSEITNPQREQMRGDDVMGLISRLSARLASDLRLPARTAAVGQASGAIGQVSAEPVAAPPPQVAQAARSTTRLDVRTALLYSKALEEMDNGNKQRAAELFRQVRDRFPDFGPAQEKLEIVSKASD
jgi:TolB-like protein